MLGQSHNGVQLKETKETLRNCLGLLRGLQREGKSYKCSDRFVAGLDGKVAGQVRELLSRLG